MKKFILEFLKRGLMIAPGGPMVLAVIYFILDATGTATVIAPSEAALGIVSLTLLAFLAGGISSIYTIDRLAPAPAALIHGAALYAGYLIVYLLNDWIPKNPFAIGAFTAIFISGYAVVWLLIWLAAKKNTAALNKKLGSAKTE